MTKTSWVEILKNFAAEKEEEKFKAIKAEVALMTEEEKKHLVQKLAAATDLSGRIPQGVYDDFIKEIQQVISS